MDFLEKEEKLPMEVKSFFRSNEVSWELEKACFLYGVGGDKIKNISGPIGLVYVGDYELKEIPQLVKENLGTEEKNTYGLAFEITKRIFHKFPDFFKDSEELLRKWEPLKSAPLISEEAAWQKVLKTEPWILEEEKNKEKELEDQKRLEEDKQRIFRSSLVKIPLGQALKEYPELGEQLVTSNRLQLKNFPEPVRPSIKNWLADYTFNLGNRKHNSMERNNYVFHGTNAKSLNSYDRQKLTCILRSFDEDSLVFVNKNTNQVVFEKENKEPEKNIKTDPNLKFSFPQKLPYETMRLKQPAPPVVKKLNPIVRIPKEEKKNEIISGKNVVNLKNNQ